MENAVIVIVGVLLVVPGLLLWWPARHDPGSRSDLGAALLTGAVVSFAVFALQLVFDARLRDIEERQQAAQAARDERLRLQAEQASLQLTIGLQRDLTRIDLQKRDLRGFYLSRKRLREAVLADADLTGANLTGADLTGADLQRARLVGAALDRANLTDTFMNQANLTEAVLAEATLANADLSGAILEGADLAGADLSGAAVGGAIYDSRTTWPESAPQAPCAAGETCEVPSS